MVVLITASIVDASRVAKVKASHCLPIEGLGFRVKGFPAKG